MKKRILSLVLAVALLFGNVNYVFAAEGTTVEPSIEQSVKELQAELAELKAALEAELAYGEAMDTVIADLEAQIAAATEKLQDAKDALTTKKASVKNLKVTNSKTTVKASWDKVASADKYKVQRYRNGLAYGKAVYTSKTSCSWTNQRRGVYYTVKVTPYAKYEGESYYGISKTSKAKYVTLKHTTVKLTVKKSGKYQKLTAGDMNSSGFQVKIAKNKSFTKGVKTYKFTTSGKSLSKSLKTSKYFSNGRKYVKVRPYTTINGKTYYGYWSSVKTKK